MDLISVIFLLLMVWTIYRSFKGAGQAREAALEKRATQKAKEMLGQQPEAQVAPLPVEPAKLVEKTPKAEPQPTSVAEVIPFRGGDLEQNEAEDAESPAEEDVQESVLDEAYLDKPAVWRRNPGFRVHELPGPASLADVELPEPASLSEVDLDAPTVFRQNPDFNVWALAEEQRARELLWKHLEEEYGAEYGDVMLDHYNDEGQIALPLVH